MFRANKFLVSKRGFSNFKEIIAMKGTPEMLQKRLPLSKIVATIGPASENMPMLSNVVNAGLRVMRINFSHATYEEADLRISNLNKCFGLNHPDGKLVDGYANMRAVMLDTQGPEIRTGSFGNGVKEVELFIDQMITLTNDPSVRTSQTPDKIWVSYQQLQKTVSVGARVLLDDGAVEVVVESMGDSHGEVVCRVQNQGVLGNKKGVNLPGLVVELPAMCDKDKVDIRWGIQNNVDYIAASFVRKAADVAEIRAYTQELRQEMFPHATGKGASHEHLPLVISKIESVEALVNFDAILAESDGIMVARGDLAVEIPMESLANVQKEIVKRCNAAGKPVIMATQMLETMQKNPRPTRAECTDVANAIFDGADCVMLSGESAKGKYPVETITLMNKIATQSELAMAEFEPERPRAVPALSDPINSMAYAVTAAATAQRHNTALAAIVVAGTADVRTGIALAKAVSAQRPSLPVLTVVPNHKEGRLLQMWKNLHPVLLKDESDSKKVLAHLITLGALQSGQQALVVRECTPGSAEVCIELIGA